MDQHPWALADPRERVLWVNIRAVDFLTTSPTPYTCNDRFACYDLGLKCLKSVWLTSLEFLSTYVGCSLKNIYISRFSKSRWDPLVENSWIHPWWGTWVAERSSRPETRWSSSGVLASWPVVLHMRGHYQLLLFVQGQLGDGAPRVVTHFYLSIHCTTPGDLGSASLSLPYRNTSQWSVIHVMLSVSLFRTCSILLHRPQRRVVPMWLNDTSVSSSTAFRYL